MATIATLPTSLYNLAIILPTLVYTLKKVYKGVTANTKCDFP